MSRLSVSIKGIEEVKKSFLIFKNETINKLIDAGASTLLDIQTTAKSPGYVPVKTGNLKRSITSNLNLNRVGNKIQIGTVGSNVEYARIQEYGGMTGRGHKTMVVGKLYLTRAINENINKLRQKLRALKIINK